jgi:hypothetical protein
MITLLQVMHQVITNAFNRQADRFQRARAGDGELWPATSRFGRQKDVGHLPGYFVERA